MALPLYEAIELLEGCDPYQDYSEFSDAFRAVIDAEMEILRNGGEIPRNARLRVETVLRTELQRGEQERGSRKRPKLWAGPFEIHLD